MATFTGTAANETITPTLVSPSIASNGGATPGAGADIINAGAGQDILDGGAGDDQLFGEDGDDRMIWNVGGGTDLFEGGLDTDTAEVNGGNAGETFAITANGTRVRFDGLVPVAFALDIGTTERLVVNMGGGDDSISATGNLAALISITIDGGAGNDTILGSNGIDTLIGGDGNDFIDGQQGNDFAFLGTGNDTFQWDPGDGSDTIEGQAGIDTLLFNGSGGEEIFAISANGNRVLMTRNLGNIVMDLDDVERVDLNALGATDSITVNDLTGTDLSRINISLAGTIGGTAGDALVDTVVINGGAGANALSVGTSLNAAIVNVLTKEAADTVTVNGLAGNDTIGAGRFLGVLTIDGGNDNDTASYAQATARVAASLTSQAGNEGAAIGHVYISIENLTGGAFDDFLTGDAGVNMLNGAGGSDYLSGLGGNDTYVVDNAGDVVIETVSQGAADAVAASVSYQLNGPARVEVLTTTNINGTSAISLTGNDFGQSITGNRGANRLDGKAGSDLLFGGFGNDTLIGGLGIDTLRGDAGNDTYVLENGTDNIIDSAGIDTATSTINRSLAVAAYLEVENLTLLGNALAGTGNALANIVTGNLKNNTLDGGAGSDTLFGLNGNDALIGGLGKDVMTGGLHNDVFLFTNKAHSVVGANADIITDFDKSGDDRINLTALFGPAMTYRHNNAFTTASQVRINDIAGVDLLVEVNTGGTLAADFQIRLKATTLASMAATDFVL